MGDQPKKMILFVCMGNTCRSPYAEGIFNKFAADAGLDYYAESAGLSVFFKVSAHVDSIILAKERGVDLSGHAGRNIDEDMMEKAERVYAMERRHCDVLNDLFPGHKAKVFMLGGDHDIDDPYGMEFEIYREMTGEVDAAVARLIDELQ